MPRLPRSKRWCGTIHYEPPFDPTESSIDPLLQLGKYAIIGVESGSGDSPHLQCYWRFENACTTNSIKEVISSIHGLKPGHFESAKGTCAQNRTYCSKEGVHYERGEIATQGKRTDLTALIEDIENGTRKRRDLFLAHPTVHARYPQFVEQALQHTAPKPSTPDITLQQWQSVIIGDIKGPPHRRTVTVVVDQLGGKGKSTFADYVQSLFEGVQILQPGKHSDIAYLLDCDARVFIFDCPRSTQERIPWNLIEQLKDGRVQSTKYQPVLKRFQPYGS